MKATFYQGHNNKVQIIFTEDDVPINLATVTNVEVELEAATFTLLLNPTLVVKLADVVELRLGASALLVGVYVARVIVYTADAPDGLVFDDALQIEVKAG